MTQLQKTAPPARFLPTLTGVSIFLAIQYAIALWQLAHSSGHMENKFSALARNQYLGFLVFQNLQMMLAYAVLALLGAVLFQPFVSTWTLYSKHRKTCVVILRSLIITALVHGYFTLRLVETRPYFLSEDEYGQWYYKALDLVPLAIKPATLFGIFTLLPITSVPFFTLSTRRISIRTEE